MAQVKNKSKKSEVEEPMDKLIRDKLAQNHTILSFNAFAHLNKLGDKGGH